MNALLAKASAWVTTQMITRVEVPNPKAPSSEDISDKIKQFGGWLSHRGATFWGIAVAAIIATICMALLKRPFVRGLVIGVIVLVIALVVIKSK